MNSQEIHDWLRGFSQEHGGTRRGDVVSGVFDWPLGPLLSGLVQAVRSLTIWQLQTWHHILSECLRMAELTWQATAGEIVRSTKLE